MEGYWEIGGRDWDERRGGGETELSGENWLINKKEKNIIYVTSMNSSKFSNVDKLIFGLNFLNLTKFNVNICLIIIIKFVHIYWYNTVISV